MQQLFKRFIEDIFEGKNFIILSVNVFKKIIQNKK